MEGTQLHSGCKVLVILLLISLAMQVTGMVLMQRQLDTSLEEAAHLLNALSEKQLGLCHQVLVTSPNETEDITQIREMFASTASVPILSYEWSAMSNPPPQTILRHPPTAQPVDQYPSEDLGHDYCVAYFILTSRRQVRPAIKDITEYNWFPGSARYMVFFLNEAVAPEDLMSLSADGGNIVHLIYVTKDMAKKSMSRRAEKKNPDIFAVTKICHFCQNGNMGVFQLGEWISGSGLKMGTSVLAKESRDFKGHVFKAVTLKFPPYITYEKGPNGELIPGDSLDIRIMDTIASVYNFTFQLMEPFDQQWGYQLENGTFTGVLGTVSRREADFSMDLLITAERESASDFTNGYLDDPLTFAIASPKPLPQWLSLIRPYSTQVWMYFLICLLIAGPFYWMALKLSPGQHRRHALDSWFELFGSMVSQSRIWEATSGIRVLIGFWLLFSLVVTKSYVGNLMAHLMVPALSPTINTLDELVKSDFKWGIADFGASNYQLFKTSQAPLYQQIFRGMDLCPSTQECLERSAEEQYAFISWRNNMREMIEKEFKDKNGKPLIYLAREDFFPSDIGFALQMGSSLKDPFDDVILRLLEGGLVPKWLTEIIEKGASQKSSAADQTESTDSDDSSDDTSKTLAMYHLQGIFIVYGVGLVFSFVLFIAEFVMNKITTSK